VEGTAGEFDTLDISHPDYSKINTNAPIKCATGHINDLSIGYDGDIDFNVNSSSLAPLVNPYNEQGGALGPPNGIVAEIPPADRGSTSITPDHQPVSQTILKLRVGMLAHICGRWVTDTRDLWNELHPITSLQILPDFTVSASPSDITILAGGQTSFSTTVKLLSGPTGAIPIQLNVLGLPSGASASFSTNPVQLNYPSTMTGTSTLQITTSTSVTLGDFPLTIQGTDQSGFAVETATVNLHVYDFTLAAPSELLVLQTGKNSWTVALSLTSGSSTAGLPAIGLSDAGLPSGATAFFTPSSGSLIFTSTFNVTTVNTPAGNYTLTLTGTDSRSPEGGSRTISRKLVVLTPQQALQLLINEVNALRSSGVLPPAQAASLASQLAAVISSLNAGKVKTACNQLSSFVNSINALVRGGILTQAQANQLLNPPLGVYAIMASIPC